MRDHRILFLLACEIIDISVYCLDCTMHIPIFVSQKFLISDKKRHVFYIAENKNAVSTFFCLRIETFKTFFCNYDLTPYQKQQAVCSYCQNEFWAVVLVVSNKIMVYIYKSPVVPKPQLNVAWVKVHHRGAGYLFY